MQAGQQSAGEGTAGGRAGLEREANAATQAGVCWFGEEEELRVVAS
jgi:hypothetical protein